MKLLKHHLAHVFGALAVLMQVILPGVAAYAEDRGVDVSHFFCTEGQTLSPEMQAAADELSLLLGETQDADDSFDDEGDCCVLCSGLHADLEKPLDPLSALVRYTQRDSFIPFEVGLVHEAQGPPVGVRGPPNNI
ncbi:MAG: hypothetical protein CMK07_09990 [Ponticaulis sp.]|nr:hypothetical protein [Ponticaulis sp.]